MPGDPFASLARAFSGSGGRTGSGAAALSPSWVYGEVVKVSPLEVEYGGVVLDADDLTVNSALLLNPGYIDPAIRDFVQGLILKVGDTVILLPDNLEQHFFVMAKAVVDIE